MSLNLCPALAPVGLETATPCGHFFVVVCFVLCCFVFCSMAGHLALSSLTYQPLLDLQSVSSPSFSFQDKQGPLPLGIREFT